MNTRDAWRWPLRSRGRLIALVLAGLALALITKTILDNAASSAAPVAGSTSAPPPNQHDREDDTDRGADQGGTVRGAMGQRARPGRLPLPGLRLHPLTPADPQPDPGSSHRRRRRRPDHHDRRGDGSGYLPEADQAAALEVTARFVDAWYAGGSDQAWRDQVTRWADPTLARELPSTDRKALPGSRRITEPAMRDFQPGLASTGVGTDAGSLALTVIYTDAGWRVVTATAEPR